MKATDAFLTTGRRERMFSTPARLFASADASPGQVIEIMGQKLEPDQTKAYTEFQISRGLQIDGQGELTGVTAWRTGQHAGSIANSHGSMLHQVFNRGHEMKSNDPDNKHARDHIIGAIVGVEFPRPPAGGWTMRMKSGAATPEIRAAAVIHKLAEGVPKILGEHLGGRHKWMVSQELSYSLLDSGFVVCNRENATAGQEELCAQLTPEQGEFSGGKSPMSEVQSPRSKVQGPKSERLGHYGYVPCVEAPDQLLECYNPEKRRVDKTWGKLPVVLMAGGLNATNHYDGVGMVRYGAERTADIQQIIANDPDALSLLEEDGMVEFFDLMREFNAAFGRLPIFQ